MQPLTLPQSPTPQSSKKVVGAAKKVKVTTKAKKVKDGPGFKVSLVVPPSKRIRCWVIKLQLGN